MATWRSAVVNSRVDGIHADATFGNISGRHDIFRGEWL